MKPRNDAFAQMLFNHRQKKAVVAAPGGVAAPPPPPPGGAPGGMPPMDPAMMGGMPPMDPSMMGGMPPEGGPVPIEQEIVSIKEMLQQLMDAQVAMMQMLTGGAPLPPPPQPMDPSMMGGMPPMDPSMMGGMPPMDPSMMGGMPPMDPSMMGMPPAPQGMVAQASHYGDEDDYASVIRDIRAAVDLLR